MFFWNYHETRRGEFDFDGEKDFNSFNSFISFIKTCERLGMKSIVRPGPYVNAEWDLGGIPAWLLTVPGINMRFMDPRYLNPAKAWMTRMGGMLAPLSIANGGPLLMVQVENEYGHHGEDTEYMSLYRGELTMGTPTDTWLDLSGFGRGTLWINGQNLGRYWKVGPVQGVFLPSCFMKKDEPNEIVVMELEAESCPTELLTSATSIWSQ